MRSVQVRDAKANLSNLVTAATNGRPTMITKHGVAVAVIVPIDDARKLYPEVMQDFAGLLLAFPGGIAFERDKTALREVEL